MKHGLTAATEHSLMECVVFQNSLRVGPTGVRWDTPELLRCTPTRVRSCPSYLYHIAQNCHQLYRASGPS